MKEIRLTTLLTELLIIAAIFKSRLMPQRKQLKLSSFFIFLLFSVFIIASCTPPRAIYNSGKVTPHKQFKVGADFSANLTSHIARSLYDNVKSVATPLLTKDSLNLNDQITYLNKTALAYAIDPFGVGYGFYARYGVASRFDLGYKFTSGTHVFDGMYQFMGSTGTFEAPRKDVLNGSAGVQYSFKSYDLPSWSGLDKAQSVLGFNFKRKDLMIPLIFSLSLGEEETYGSVAFGCVYSRTFINYGFGNNRIYDTLNHHAPQLVNFLDVKNNFSAFGTFFNIKLGYKFIYVIPACALYYQNYGTYKLIDGSEAKFKGFSFVPSLGVQINPTEISKALKKKQGVKKV